MHNMKNKLVPIFNSDNITHIIVSLLFLNNQVQFQIQ